MSGRGTLGVLAGAVVALATQACGSVGTSTQPEVAGAQVVQYSMAQSELHIDTGLPPNLLIVMTLLNTSDASVTRTYPAGCPVAMRVYRLLDSALVYDETRRPCSLTTPASIQVLPGQSRTIGSGFRQMTGIMGDSIPCGHYRLVGVPMTEGESFTEFDAGEAFLRAYPAWPASNPDAVYQC